MLYLVPTIILFLVGHYIVEVDPYKIRLSTIETLLSINILWDNYYTFFER